MKLLFPLALLTASTLALSFRSPAETAGTIAAPGPGPIPAALESGTYAVDAGHSSVLFRCLHLGVSQFYGRFNQVAGEVVYDEADLAASSIRVTIPSDSIDSNSEGRDRHLKSNDFLSVKEFPEIAFESTAVKAIDDEELEITGDLTFHGETHEVVARAKVVGSGETPFGDTRAGFEASFTFDMRDYGVAFVEKNPSATGPEVQIIVSLECIKQ